MNNLDGLCDLGSSHPTVNNLDGLGNQISTRGFPDATVNIDRGACFQPSDGEQPGWAGLSRLQPSEGELPGWAGESNQYAGFQPSDGDQPGWAVRS